MRSTRRLGGLVAIGALAALTLASSVTAAGGSSDGCSNRDGRYGSWGNDRNGNQRLSVLGITADLRLFCFASDTPNNTRSIGTVRGLVGDTSLVGMDFRPSDGKLYAVGNAGGIYTIDTRNAAATKVDQLDVALSGTLFGVDVNPAADALRVISDNGQNLRHPFLTTTTVVDISLNYPGVGPATGVTGAAYTNNDADANTATTLYDIDSTLDQVAIQSPANSGQLAATGKLGVDTTASVGFDIYSRISSGTTVDLKSFATLNVGGRAQFYEITLFSGKARSVGAFTTNRQAVDIAIPLNQL